MLWVDAEPQGGRRWSVVLHGVLDRRSRDRLLDECAALALAGAEEVDLSLAGLTWLDSAGVRTLADLEDRLGHLGIVLRVGGAIGQPDERLRALHAAIG
jgi:ABC-type transporter Mla MlaB component